MIKKYKHLFFDLDKTLWDFEKNSKETLTELYNNYKLSEKNIESFDVFFEKYTEINIGLWDLYRKGEIKKEYLSLQRFELTFNKFGFSDVELAQTFANDYISISPQKTHLFPGAIEVLEELCIKYELHVITNGFKEVQYKKLNNSGLNNFFKTIITSEEAGFMKPDPKVFLYALEKAEATASESIMIGDDLEVDILSAQNFGMDQIFVNYEAISHDEKPTFEITNLFTLLEIF
ncbi:MAG: noncanonical pyrimidine nucleotidase, YjjG family [Bacteroidetes bacterium]|nr:noncanonical pyrimidine nucleotidase, YjjG family [Bacteroidota bacterium]